MQKHQKILLILSMTSIMGCSPMIVLHPVTGTDMYAGKNLGDECFSQAYIHEIMKAKIEALR